MDKTDLKDKKEFNSATYFFLQVVHKGTTRATTIQTYNITCSLALHYIGIDMACEIIYGQGNIQIFSVLCDVLQEGCLS